MIDEDPFWGFGDLNTPCDYLELVQFRQCYCQGQSMTFTLSMTGEHVVLKEGFC